MMAIVRPLQEKNMKKKFVLGLAMSIALAAISPAFGQGVIKKVEDKTKDAAEATAKETKKAAKATEKTTKKVADATEKGATTAAKDTKTAAVKTKDATETVGKAAVNETKKAADTAPVKATEKAATTVGKDTAKGAEKVGGAVAGAAKTTSTAVKNAAEKPTPVSDAEIKAAQASGKVWVNTSSGVYHKSGAYFGHTKEGKFMTEAEAKAAGYRVAK
jgi:hypothetical protein